MPAPNQGLVSYPGIQAYESFEITDVCGVHPASGTMKVFPQYGLPAENGDLVMTYNGTTITFKNCHIDSASYETGSGGQIVNVRFMDERWTWASASISGKYNYRLPNNWVDPNHEQTPQQLATLCFQALGVQVFDVSQLPNDARPEADWDHANPAQELEKICNDLGCRVVPVRSLGGWKICLTGIGNNLPDNYPFLDAGQGIDPQETPDYIKIVSGPIRYQVFLPLGAIGKDIDLSWKALKDLSYAPNPNADGGGFGYAGYFLGLPISNVRITLPDGTKISPVELANETVYRAWRLDFTNAWGARQTPPAQSNGPTNLPTPAVWSMRIPGITYNNGYVTVEQIILSDKLVQTYTDYLGAQHERPSFVCGQFFGNKTDGLNPYYPMGTRIDKQAPESNTTMDERSSFSLSLDPIDTNRSIITTSSPMMISYTVDSGFSPAILQYCCAIHVRDPQTWQPARYEYLHHVGNGTNPNFCRTVIKDDIQPWVIGNYPTGSTAFTSFTHNFDEVQQQSLYYAQSIANEYTTVTSATRTYVGLFPIDMDGAIQQITYSIDKGGASTQASQGTEHHWYTPGFEERRQQIARQGIAEKVQYVRYESARRQALIGSYNT